MTADPAREAALQVVRAVDTDEAYANLLLPGILRTEKITGRDAAFATELTYGTLRWQGVLDAVIGACGSRSVATLDPTVRAVLRLGAYQLLHMRVAAHGAVHASVELVRGAGAARATGYVNAVLRRVSERPFAEWVTVLAPDETEDPVGHLAFASGYPSWVASAFDDALGGDRAALAAALAEDRPVTHLVARPGRISRDELLAEAGAGAEAGPLSPYAVRMAGGDPHDLRAVRSGAAAVQDEGSQHAAIVLASAPLVGPDQTWLDMCAGPGGKAALLAGLGAGRGARLVAVDRAPHRARLTAAALAGENGSLTLIADSTQPAWVAGVFDRVLLDAPCSGLGAVRRRPELRWRRQPGDIPRLVELQQRLLVAALAAVRPGGLVGYVTCSPHRSETRDVIARVLAEHAGVHALGHSVQLWPHIHGTDAIFVAVLRRT